MLNLKQSIYTENQKNKHQLQFQSLKSEQMQYIVHLTDSQSQKKQFLGPQSKQLTSNHLNIKGKSKYGSNSPQLQSCISYISTHFKKVQINTVQFYLKNILQQNPQKQKATQYIDQNRRSVDKNNKHNKVTNFPAEYLRYNPSIKYPPNNFLPYNPDINYLPSCSLSQNLSQLIEDQIIRRLQANTEQQSTNLLVGVSTSLNQYFDSESDQNSIQSCVFKQRLQNAS